LCDQRLALFPVGLAPTPSPFLRLPIRDDRDVPFTDITGSQFVASASIIRRRLAMSGLWGEPAEVRTRSALQFVTLVV
jgi:hypothetical protein